MKDTDKTSYYCPCLVDTKYLFCPSGLHSFVFDVHRCRRHASDARGSSLPWTLWCSARGGFISLESKDGSIPIPKESRFRFLGHFSHILEKLESKELLEESKRICIPIPNSSFHKQAKGIVIYDSWFWGIDPWPTSTPVSKWQTYPKVRSVLLS